MFKAKVFYVRSWDAGVYLIPVDDNGKEIPNMRGWTVLNDLGHGIAAAARATDKPVCFTYTNHYPQWYGQGLYEGVKMAFSPQELP